jgi:hypothetical protein
MITALINGKHTEVDEATLTPNHSVIDNDNELTKVTEYLLDGVVVHRSVHVHLKKGLDIAAIAADIGG